MLHIPDDLMLLQRRVTKLEQENRIIKRGVLLLAGCALSLWLIARTGPQLQADEAKSPTKQVKAQQFLLVDADGVTRAELGLDPAGPLLRFVDEKGSPRLVLSQQKQTTTAAFCDENGRVRSTFGTGKDGPYWRFDDGSGKQRFAVGVVPDGTFLRIDDDGGKQRFGLLIGRSAASVTVFNAAGQVILSRSF